MEYVNARDGQRQYTVTPHATDNKQINKQITRCVKNVLKRRSNTVLTQKAIVCLFFVFTTKRRKIVEKPIRKKTKMFMFWNATASDRSTTTTIWTAYENPGERHRCRRRRRRNFRTFRTTASYAQQMIIRYDACCTHNITVSHEKYATAIYLYIIDTHSRRRDPASLLWVVRAIFAKQTKRKKLNQAKHSRMERMIMFGAGQTIGKPYTHALRATPVGVRPRETFITQDKNRRKKKSI